MLCQVILILGTLSNVTYVQHRHVSCTKVSHVDMWAEVNECKENAHQCKLSATKDKVTTTWYVRPEVR